MARAVVSTDAESVYLDRYHRPWSADGWLGYFFAVTVETARRTTLRADLARRLAAGEPPRRSVGPVPAWLEHGQRIFGKWMRQSGADFGASGTWIAHGDRAVLAAAVDGDAELPTEFGSLDEASVKAAAERIHVPAAKDALQVFYEGVRLVVIKRTGKPPTASQLALLAAAAGLEEFDRLTTAAKKWEDRVRTWKHRPVQNLPLDVDVVDALGQSLPI